MIQETFNLPFYCSVTENMFNKVVYKCLTIIITVRVPIGLFAH